MEGEGEDWRGRENNLALHFVKQQCDKLMLG